MVGTAAVEQQEINPQNTIYDAKRFIGKIFQKDDFIFQVFYLNIYFFIFLF